MNSPSTVNLPSIDPDYGAPFFHGLQIIASYVLAAAMILVFIMLVIAAAALSFRGLAPDRVRTWAGEHIVLIFASAAALGAANGLFAWFVNFDFGF